MPPSHPNTLQWTTTAAAPRPPDATLPSPPSFVRRSQGIPVSRPNATNRSGPNNLHSSMLPAYTLPFKSLSSPPAKNVVLSEAQQKSKDLPSRFPVKPQPEPTTSLLNHILRADQFHPTRYTFKTASRQLRSAPGADGGNNPRSRPKFFFSKILHKNRRGAGTLLIYAKREPDVHTPSTKLPHARRMGSTHRDLDRLAP